MIAAACVYFVNKHGANLLEWLLANLGEHVRFKISRTEWRGFTTVVPQILVATKPIALTIQVDSGTASEEVARLVNQVRGRIDATALAALAQSRTRLDIMSADSVQPKIDEKARTMTVVATTNLDPKAADVDAVLTALLDLTGGFAVDAVNNRYRAARQQKWISG